MALRGCSDAQLRCHRARRQQPLRAQRAAAPLPRACAAPSPSPPPPPPRAAPAAVTPPASSYVLTAAEERQELPRRIALLAALAAATCSPLSACAEATASGALTRYVDSKSAFALARPVSWELTSKPGANVLFKDPTASLSTLGVTVSPVLVPSLEQFGSLDDVTQKLVAAERAKESTLSVEVLSASQRRSSRGALLYEVDYLLDSSRGRKRVLTAACIDASTLYLLALQFAAPLPPAEGAPPPPPPPVAALAADIFASFEPGVRD